MHAKYTNFRCIYISSPLSNFTQTHFDLLEHSEFGLCVLFYNYQHTHVHVK